MNKPIQTLHRRTMRRILSRIHQMPQAPEGGFIITNLEELRIVIGGALTSAYRMGYRVGASRRMSE